MSTFIIADTHFNHKNIIDYCNRPFTDVDNMNTALIQNWNSVVKSDDIVYHLGDFAVGTIDIVKHFRAKLNGKIFLIKGNHDGYNIKRYYEAGFDKVYDKPILLENQYILSHKPISITNDIPYINIYGHVHNNSQYKDFTKNTYCVSCERTGYKPIPFKTIMINLKKLDDTK